MNADFAPGFDATIHPKAFDGRKIPVDHLAALGKKPGRRVFCVEANLDGGAFKAHRLLSRAKLLALRNPNLLLDEIQPGEAFGDRMLDLKAGVHLEEVEAPIRRQNELHRPGVLVPDRLAA